MRWSVAAPAFVGFLFVIAMSACGTTAPQATPIPLATAAPAAAATSAPPPTAAPTEAPPTAAAPTAAPTTAAATEAPAAEAVVAPANVHVSAASPEDAGRYLMWLGGCNDCHTVGWEASEGTMPESAWLTGGRKFSGAYGTTYSANLRLVPENMTEAEFVEMMRTRTVNPPMPWVHYKDLDERDLSAIYSFLKSLGPAGEPAQPFEPPPAQSPTPAPTSANPTAAPTAPAAPTPTAVPENLRPVVPADAFIDAASPALAGEYFMWVGHCNACHTNDWTPTTPKSDWLTGGRKFNSVGGVAYAGNLRLIPENMTEAEFVEMMHTKENGHPPMGWLNFRNLNDKDLAALYAFFASLGPKGEPAPPFEPTKP